MYYLATDKHGLNVSLYVTEYFQEKSIQFTNLGIHSEGEDIRLEDMIPPFVDKIRESESNRGILICGTGIGVEIGANKFASIRACLATTPQIAQWASEYDTCNVLCLVGWDDDKEKVFALLDAWINTSYDGDEGRLKMFEAFDTWH